MLSEHMEVVAVEEAVRLRPIPIPGHNIAGSHTTRQFTRNRPIAWQVCDRRTILGLSSVQPASPHSYPGQAGHYGDATADMRRRQYPGHHAGADADQGVVADGDERVHLRSRSPPFAAHRGSTPPDENFLYVFKGGRQDVDGPRACGLFGPTRGPPRSLGSTRRTYSQSDHIITLGAAINRGSSGGGGRSGGMQSPRRMLRMWATPGGLAAPSRVHCRKTLRRR